MVKIYTKSGDSGTTGLYGGSRVSKDAPRIRSYGEIDELNAVVGIVRAETQQAAVREALARVQASLFTLGAQLASPKQDPKIEVITAKDVDFLERQIDVISDDLPPLRNFILPGGCRTAAFLHLARTVCRRAERSMVQLSNAEEGAVNEWLLIYINRLSDFLFVLARLANQLESVEDVDWVPQRKG